MSFEVIFIFRHGMSFSAILPLSTRRDAYSAAIFQSPAPASLAVSRAPPPPTLLLPRCCDDGEAALRAALPPLIAANSQRQSAFLLKPRVMRPFSTQAASEKRFDRLPFSFSRRRLPCQRFSSRLRHDAPPERPCLFDARRLQVDTVMR